MKKRGLFFANGENDCEKVFSEHGFFSLVLAKRNAKRASFSFRSTWHTLDTALFLSFLPAPSFHSLFSDRRGPRIHIFFFCETWQRIDVPA